MRLTFDRLRNTGSYAANAVRSPTPELALGLPLTLALAWGTALWMSLPGYFILGSGLVYGAMAVVLGATWKRQARRTGREGDFGWANRVTLLRAVPVILIAALIPYPEAAAAHGWALALASLCALALDGVDGSIARRSGSESAFGARFDMELDALFLLALALIIISMGKAGAWVLAIGLIRYGFVAAMYGWPWLDQSLPASFRRKTVCVWQVATLLVCLLPPVTPDFASLALAVALGLLVYSFAVDLRWLSRQRRYDKTHQEQVSHDYQKTSD